MAKPRTLPVFAVGDTVRLTASFLRSTGQYTGCEPHSRWTVKAIDGDYVVTDAPNANADCYTAEELTANPLLRCRRIHRGNLEVVAVAKAVSL